MKMVVMMAVVVMKMVVMVVDEDGGDDDGGGGDDGGCGVDNGSDGSSDNDETHPKYFHFRSLMVLV